MSNKRYVLIFCATILFAFNCYSQKGIANRYKKKKTTFPNSLMDSVLSIELVKVGVYCYPIKEKSNDDKNMFNLSERGQEAYIRAISRKENESQGIIDNLSTSFTEKEKPLKVENKTKFKRRVVIAVQNQSVLPADRITKFSIELELNPKVGIKYTTWNKITSQFQTIDIAKVDFSKGDSFTLSPELGAATFSASVGSYSSQKSISEEMNLKQRYVVLSGTLSDNKASLYQEGIEGIDLTGNIIADIEIEITNAVNKLLFSFDNLYNKNGKTNNKDSIKLNQKRIKVPNITSDIKINTLYNYTIRAVKQGKGDDTYLESDDEATYNKSCNVSSGEAIIIPLDELKTPTWCICYDSNPLLIQPKGYETKITMEFASYEDAEAYFLWLKDKNEWIQKMKLQLKDGKLDSKNKDLLSKEEKLFEFKGNKIFANNALLNSSIDFKKLEITTSD